MTRRPCTAYMTIYVPVDPNTRLACVVLDASKPHTHPMPPLAKLSLDVDKVYRKCVRAAGVLGTTVQKVDDGAYFYPVDLIPIMLIIYDSIYDHSPLKGPVSGNVPSIPPHQTTETGHYTFRKAPGVARRTWCWR
jgi:hypothetical protein